MKGKCFGSVIIRLRRVCWVVFQKGCGIQDRKSRGDSCLAAGAGNSCCLKRPTVWTTATLWPPRLSGHRSFVGHHDSLRHRSFVGHHDSLRHRCFAGHRDSLRHRCFAGHRDSLARATVGHGARRDSPVLVRVGAGSSGWAAGCQVHDLPDALGTTRPTVCQFRPGPMPRVDGSASWRGGQARGVHCRTPGKGRRIAMVDLLSSPRSTA